MSQFVYRQPDFGSAALRGAPLARFVPAPANGVMPDDFFATTNLPTYVKTADGWRRPVQPRMDGVIVMEEGNALSVREPRQVRQGGLVAVGEAEDGTEGILVHSEGFLGVGHSANEFRFMATAVSRERPVDYQLLADLLIAERQRGGSILWVAGPALVHSRARKDLVWFIERGYVNCLFGGNAVAVHDLEEALFGTTLGIQASGEPATHGHALHMRAINTIRKVGSIEAAVEQDLVRHGIMYALVRRSVPYVLAGSIRDDGPLPGVITDAVEAQDAMRRHTGQTTCAVFVATALHAIAVGNMLPAYVDQGGDRVRPLPTICVDQTEFVVSKLRDRGTHQAYGVVTNAQDFMHVLRFYVERWEQSRPSEAVVARPA